MSTNTAPRHRARSAEAAEGRAYAKAWRERNKPHFDAIYGTSPTPEQINRDMLEALKALRNECSGQPRRHMLRIYVPQADAAIRAAEARP